MKIKIDKNKKIKLIGLAAFAGILLYITASQTTPLEDQRESVETAGGVTKTYNSLSFEQSGVSLQQQVLDMKDMLEKTMKRVDNIKNTGPQVPTTIKKGSRKYKFFDKKVEMTLGKAFISTTGFFFIQQGDDLKKYIYNKGVEKEILAQQKQPKGKKQLKFITMEDTTFQIFPDKTTLYYLINGDELFITEKNNEKEAYIITKDGRLESGLKIDSELNAKIEKSIKSRVFTSGEFIIVDKDNIIVENGNFNKYFFQGRQYTTSKKEQVEKYTTRFLSKPYLASNDLYKVEYSLLKNNAKVYLNKNKLYMNAEAVLPDIEELFVDRQNNALILKYDGKLFENDLSPRVTFLLNYTDEFGVFYSKNKNEIITKTELNGNVAELGKGNIVLLANGKITIEITGREVKELSFKKDLSGKTKFYQCKDGRYAIEKLPVLETFTKNNELIKTYDNPSVKIIEKKLLINDEPFCELEKVLLKDEKGGRTEIHKGPIVTDDEGNKYFEKGGNVYKIGKDGKVEKVGKGQINDDGTIKLDNGETIQTKFDIKDAKLVMDDEGNTYFEKDGKVYKIGKDGKVTDLGGGHIDASGQVKLDNGEKIETAFESKDAKLVTDDEGNTYFEKGGKVYKIGKDGNVSEVGNGQINDDGTITLEDGSKLKTAFDPKKSGLVKDDEGNQYFEKGGNIYKIGKDGKVEKVGKGQINDNGTITLEDGTKLKTRHDLNKTPLLKDDEGNQYFEKGGNIYKIGKDGKVEKVGKGTVGKDGKITLEDGSVIDTEFDTKDSQNLLQLDDKGDITSILENIEYRYKEGKMMVDHYLLKNEPVVDIKIENMRSFVDFSKKNSIEIAQSRILQVTRTNWGIFEDFRDTVVEKDGDNISLKQNGKKVYFDTIKSLANLKTKKYLFSENRNLFVFPGNEMFFEDKEGKLTYLDKHLYEVIINKDRFIVSIKKKIDLDDLRPQHEREEDIDIMYDPNSNQLLYIKNGKIINRKDAEELFNSKVKKYQINMTEPEKMNPKFIVFTENGSELTYSKNGIKYIDPNGKVLEGEGNIYLTNNKDEVILKQKGMAKSFKIKYINIKNQTLVKTEKGAFIIDKDNIIAKHVKGNVYLKMKGSFAISVDKENNTVIKGPNNIPTGGLLEVLELKNTDYVIQEKIEKGERVVIQKDNTDYDKILRTQKQYMESELAKMREELLTKMEKEEPKKQAEAINYDMDLIQMKRLFKEPNPNKNDGQNPNQGYMGMGGQLELSRISDKDMEKLLREHDLAEAGEGEEQYLFLPIGTKFYAKIEEAYEVPVITGANGGTSDLNVKFKGIKISRITTPRGEEISFNQDALMLGALKGNRATERIYIYPESVNWYNEEEDKYLKIELSGATKVSSRKDKIEGIPGLFINKKMDNIIMSAGLEMVKGITEAIVASQSPMNDMMNPDMSGLLGQTQTSATPSTGENLGTAALGGASGAFEEIINMIKEDMEGLIPFLVSNEGEDIIITLTKDIRVTERDGEQ